MDETPSEEAGSSSCPTDGEAIDTPETDPTPEGPAAIEMTGHTLTSMQAQEQSKELEKLSMWVLEASNDKEQLQAVLSYMDKSLFTNRSDHEVQPSNRNPSSHIDNQKDYLQKNPHRKVQALNASCLISDNLMQGDVFITTVVQGFFGQFTRESVTHLKWRRRNGQWKCVEYNMLRGSGGGALQSATPVLPPFIGPSKPP